MTKKQKYFLLSLILGLGIVYAIWVNGFNNILVLVDNNQIEYKTRANIVEDVLGELLKKDELTLGELDIVTPSLTSNVAEDLIIKIIRVEKKVITIREEIPYVKEYKHENNILNGQKRIIKNGQTGILSKTYLVTYQDGIEQKKEFIKDEILQEPVAEIIALGTKQIVQRAGKNLDVKKTLTMKSTAYTHTGNKTATGKWPQRGTIAVDPKVIPLGSKLYIDGYGFGVAQDIGSAIKGEHLDLFMDSEKEALKWGSKTVRVYVLN